MRETVLIGQHKALGAKMVPFGGWEMPVQYSGIVEEHLHTRQKAGLFDICHMGEFMVSGAGAGAVLDQLLSSLPTTIALGKCRYGLMLNAHGATIDDVITYRCGENEWMLVVNAATRDGDLAHLRKHLAGKGSIEDHSESIAKLDLQGPESFRVLKDVLGIDARGLKYFSFEKQGDLLISRTGYTGELGVELYFPVERAVDVWNSLLTDSRVLPIGLGARDTLRLECALSLYGHELNDQTNAAHCGVSRFLPTTGGYLGFDAIEAELSQPTQTLIGLKSPNRSAPRAGEAVLADGVQVGEITSGSFAPSLGFGIALARVNREATHLAKVLEVDKGRRHVPVELCSLPFYTGSARQKIS